MASKKESTFINMVLTLFIVALVASTTLGYVYEFTKEPIALAKKAKLEKAIKLVVPEFDSDPATDKYEIPVEGDEALECYPVRKGGELVGTAIRTYSDKGFTTRIYIMVGLLNDGTIYDTQVLFHQETPGLGDKMDRSKSDFPLQFKDKNPAQWVLKVKKDGGDVDAITAATISSRAFADAVDLAFKKYMEKGVKQ